MDQTGGCLCGAVRFEARDVPAKVSICHCEMCRRWTGSALLDVDIPEENMIWHGQEAIAKRQTSPFAERAWCRECGTGLYFRMTEENDYSGRYGVPIGLFDDPNGFEVRSEIFIDQKPDSFAFQGEHKTFTRAQCVAMFPAIDKA